MTQSPAILSRDRDTEGRYLLTVTFSSYSQAMENSNRPESGEFASFLSRISNGLLNFRNLDLLRHENF